MRLVARALGLSLALVAAPAGATTVLDRIVAVVNDEVILLSELEGKLQQSPVLEEALNQYGRNPTQQQIEQATREARSRVLDELIDQLLIKKEAARFQLSVTEAEVDRYLEQIAQANNLKGIAELREAIEQSGQLGTWADYRQDTKDDLLVFQTTRALANVAVTDAQVREQYRKMVRGEDIKVDIERFLFTTDVTSAAARDVSYAKAQAAARRMRAGEEPAAVAAEFAMPNTRATLARGEVAPSIEDAIFAARVNEVVGPLETGQGYLVVKVLRHDAGSVLTFDQAKDRIRQQLENEAFTKAVADLRTSLRAKAHIDPRL